MVGAEIPEDFELLRRFGKWSEAGVPHRDWYCVSEFDAIDEFGDLVICEMCEKQQIRFVHVMAHERFDALLNCGCICATHMSGDSKAAELREKRMRSRSSRKRSFPNRKGWKKSVKGNPYIKTQGVNIVIVKNKDGFFRFGFKNVWENDFIWGKVGYHTIEEAKLGSFDAYEKLRVDG